MCRDVRDSDDGKERFLLLSTYLFLSPHTRSVSGGECMAELRSKGEGVRSYTYTVTPYVTSATSLQLLFFPFLGKSQKDRKSPRCRNIRPGPGEGPTDGDTRGSAYADLRRVSNAKRFETHAGESRLGTACVQITRIWDGLRLGRTLGEGRGVREEPVRPTAIMMQDGETRSYHSPSRDHQWVNQRMAYLRQ